MDEWLRGGGDVRALLLFVRMERRGDGECGREEGWDRGLVEGVAMVGDAEEKWTAAAAVSGPLDVGRRVSLFVIHASEDGGSAIARSGEGRKEGRKMVVGTR